MRSRSVATLCQALLLLAALGSPALTAQAKEVAVLTAPDPSIKLTLATIEAERGLVLNRLTTLLVTVEAQDPAQAAALTFGPLLFDARMPEHNHGMIVKPVPTQLSPAATPGPGSYRIDGVKLHMAGAWELTLTLDVNGKPVVVKTPVKL